ncbi:MAG: hypothetical protein Q8830_03520 [Candidatus Phytoplasma australasiaticum]|nr:hypothetical protein [Candidatus Phytoplasma australasiaticum]
MPVKTSDGAKDYAKVYVLELMKLNGVHYSLYQTKVLIHFLLLEDIPEGPWHEVEIKYRISSPNRWTSKRIIPTLENMLRACVLNFKGNWDDHLPFIEFAYNNSFHSTYVKNEKFLYVNEIHGIANSFNV